MTTVLHYLEPATHGVPNFVAFLAKHQARAGHDVHILGPSPRAVPGVEWHDDTMTRASLRSISRSGKRAVALASEVDADVVHVHSFFAGMALRMRAIDRPVFYTPHAWPFERDGLGRRSAVALERLLLARTSRVLCVSEGAAQNGRDALGKNTPIASIGSAIDLDRFGAVAPGLEQQALSPYVVCVGRISEQKGQLTLAEQWSETLGELPVNLVFVGDQHPDIADDEYPKSFGNVHFVGSSNDVPSWLSGAEFAVQPSRWEAMSLATAEALGCATPVVATNVAGMAEAIVDGPLESAGVVVDGIDDIVPAIVQQLDHPAQLSRQRIAARRRAEALFSPDRLVQAVHEHYGEFIDSTIDVTEPIVLHSDPTDITNTEPSELAA